MRWIGVRICLYALGRLLGLSFNQRRTVHVQLHTFSLDDTLHNTLLSISPLRGSSLVRDARGFDGSMANEKAVEDLSVAYHLNTEENERLIGWNYRLNEFRRGSIPMSS